MTRHQLLLTTAFVIVATGWIGFQQLGGAPADPAPAEPPPAEPVQSEAASPGPAAAATTAPAEPETAEVPVKVVILYSSGVGYFEHFGRVEGGTHAELRFRTDDINDLLKSLVVQDMGGGAVSRITYPTEEPVSKALEGFEVDVADNLSLAELLKQLRGETVTVSLGAERVTGKVLGLEKQPRAVEGEGVGAVEVWYLSLASQGVLRSVELRQVRTIEVQDPRIQRALDEALEALARAKDQEKKPVRIHFRGEQGHDVRIGYVTETPIWKTSYRLVLPAEGGEGGGEPRLQGWAIVTNQTDNDWQDVRLSLVSGRPLSFVQDLSQPLYVPRPVVEPELYANLKPAAYEAGVEKADRAAAAGGVELERKQTAGKAARRDATNALSARRLRAMPQAAAAAGEKRASLDRAIDPTASVASVASTADLGELFQYTLDDVSLQKHRSAMFPIVTDAVRVDRLSVYNHEVLADHPLTGARVTNTTGKHLQHGPVTVYDGHTYAGDARIDSLPPGQQRLISYGIDLQVLVNSTKSRTETDVVAGTIVNGVLHLTRKSVVARDYVIQNKSDQKKVVLVQHPFRQGWELVEPREPLETTDRFYRFQTEVPAGETTTLTVREQIVNEQTVALLPQDAGQLLAYAKGGQISPEVRDALRRAAELKRAVAETEQAIAERRQEIEEIASQQARIRENMKTVAQNSEYYNRLLTKLDEQETRIESLRTRVEELQAQRDVRRQELEQYLNGLSVSGPGAAAPDPPQGGQQPTAGGTGARP